MISLIGENSIYTLKYLEIVNPITFKFFSRQRYNDAFYKANVMSILKAILAKVSVQYSPW